MNSINRMVEGDGDDNDSVEKNMKEDDEEEEEEDRMDDHHLSWLIISVGIGIDRLLSNIWLQTFLQHSA